MPQGVSDTPGGPRGKESSGPNEESCLWHLFLSKSSPVFPVPRPALCPEGPGWAVSQGAVSEAEPAWPSGPLGALCPSPPQAGPTGIFLLKILVVMTYVIGGLPMEIRLGNYYNAGDEHRQFGVRGHFIGDLWTGEGEETEIFASEW